MEPDFELTDERWNLISDLFHEPPRRPQGGRPPAPARGCFEGILWILRSGARWKDLPKHFPSSTTCWRRHKEWTEAGVWKTAWARLVRALDRRGRVKHEESFADGTFSPAKKGAKRLGKTKRGKGTKIMVFTDAEGLPLGADTASASPHEVTLIEPLLETRVLRRKPQRLVYDEAADSDPLRERLQQRGIELVCRHRRNRVKPPTQDGRKLRRFRRRWKVERSISWLQNFRRLVTRYEFHAHLFHGFVQLACLIVVLGRF
ncbi:MAG TPA: IS5 family transposase [Pirellulaceae bacterium]|nr:IS5 family transposase [Pirellulaceae bacterium]